MRFLALCVSMTTYRCYTKFFFFACRFYFPLNTLFSFFLLRLARCTTTRSAAAFASASISPRWRRADRAYSSAAAATRCTASAVAGAAAGGRRGRQGRPASQHVREVRTTKSRGGHTSGAATVKPDIPPRKRGHGKRRRHRRHHAVLKAATTAALWRSVREERSGRRGGETGWGERCSTTRREPASSGKREGACV